MEGLELEILRDARWINERHDQGHGREGWFKPMHVGGTDASPHSRVLTKLVKRGLIERMRWGRAYAYRITGEGLRELVKLDAASSTRGDQR